MQPETNYYDLAPCCYFAFDDRGLIRDVNQTLCNLTGYSKEKLINKSVEIIFTIPTRIFYQTHFFPILKLQGHAEEIFITLCTHNGDQLPILCNAVKQENKEVLQFSCVGIVVHNRKKFEEELIAAKNMAEKALNENTELNSIKKELIQRTESLDHTLTMVNRQNQELRQFNRAVTHDLQEPLRKMSLFLNMMHQGERGLTENDRERISNKVIQISKDMQEVVSGLQQYVWVHERGSHFVTINLNTILNSVQRQLINEEGEECFELKSDSLPVINGDRTQIHLLLYHLIKNAIRFRKPNQKAQININSTIVKQNEYKNLKGRYSYKDHLRIEVYDKGVGFDPEYKLEIFDLFKKLHHNTGRGVGLALCKMVVENHHGSIYADSKPGEGTTITVMLPVNLKVETNQNME